MEDKSKTNDTTPSTEPARPIRASGGDYIVVQGNVGPGANLGRGSVHIDQLAGRDLIVNGRTTTASIDQFQVLLEALRDMVEAARASGELDDQAAQTVLGEINSVADLASSKPPPKTRLIEKLQQVAESLEATHELLTTGGKVARILIKAIPIAALLVKLANALF